MSHVGIIANPASGRDIRRLVGYGSTFDNQEKVRIVRRVIHGLVAAGVGHISYMPDCYGIIERALGGIDLASIQTTFDRLTLRLHADQRDSTEAARLMVCQDAGCIVTLGGDGTNRVVAKGSATVPIMPLSSGTNNVFPAMIEGTVAGLAAGLIATGKVEAHEGARQSTCLEILMDDVVADTALVDAVVCDDQFVGSRAIWEMTHVRQIFLNRATLGHIGFSAIGAMIEEISPDDPKGICFTVAATGLEVTAPVGPGMIESVRINKSIPMPLGEKVPVYCDRGVIALDGEREVEFREDSDVAVRVSEAGPVVVNVRKTMAAAKNKGWFISELREARMGSYLN